MFEKATRIKLRFNFRGQCSVEDLWDLSVTDLDSIYRDLKRDERELQGDSLLEAGTTANKTLALQIGIIKHIVCVKLEDQKAREEEVARAEKKQKLYAIIARKQDAELEGMSLDDLNKMVADL